MESKASAAAAVARGLGHPSRGLTIRSSLNPKFLMDRAAIPIFSPSCGSTSMKTGGFMIFVCGGGRGRSCSCLRGLGRKRR
jgi:hypothetical protein